MRLSTLRAFINAELSEDQELPDAIDRIVACVSGNSYGWDPEEPGSREFLVASRHSPYGALLTDKPLHPDHYPLSDEEVRGYAGDKSSPFRFMVAESMSNATARLLIESIRLLERSREWGRP